MTALPDFDVLVIGGGPAGIAAAVRVRWVKRYHVIPCKVAIVEPSTLGGLTQMGTCVVTGPGWMYNAETVWPLLGSDLERFHIPHLRGRVRRVDRQDALFQVEVDGLGSLTARAVVIACGMKMLGREPALWDRGVTATSMGVQWTMEKLRTWAQDQRLRRIVFVGSERLAAVIPFVDRWRRPGLDVRYVIEPIAGLTVPLPRHADVISGTVVELLGQDRLEAVTVELAGGTDRQLIDAVDLLVVDFLSYELRPARTFACEGLATDEAGFVVVDRRQRTGVPGLFAAGDVTGMPACVGKAIGEGIVAGFEAYRHVFQQKFGSEPPLFAYYGHEVPASDDFMELPRLDDDHHAPELLGPVGAVLPFALDRTPHEERATMERVICALGSNGKERSRSLGRIAREDAIPIGDVRRAVSRLLELKMATVQDGAS